MARVFIPSLLRVYTGGKDEVHVEGASLRRVIINLDASYPGIKSKILDDAGEIQDGLAIAIDGVTGHMGLLEPVGEHSEVHFIPAIGGG